MNLIFLLILLVVFVVAVISLSKPRATSAPKPRQTPPQRQPDEFAPRMNLADEVKFNLEVRLEDPSEPVRFKFISSSHLCEVVVGLHLANRGVHRVTVDRIAWDIWMEGLHIKYGVFTEKTLLEPGTERSALILREVLKDSETADLSWANQLPKPSCHLEVTLFCQSAMGHFKKIFSLNSLAFTLDKEGLHFRTSEFVRDSYIDSLTGLLQRKFIDDNLQTIINRNITFDPLSLIMLDIDEFKFINDTYGHVAGDEVLKHVGARIKAVVDERGFCVRYGGDEMCIILENCPLALARQIAESILTEVRGCRITADHKPVSFTISIGIASVSEKIDDKTLIRHADEMLLFSKKTGKNKISVDNRRLRE